MTPSQTRARRGGRRWLGLAVLAAFLGVLGLAVYLLVLLVIALAGVIGGAEPPVKVPAVVGKSLEEARGELADLGLELVVRERVPSNEYPEGSVINQRPAAGRTVRKGRRVEVWVSTGSAVVQVPDLTGLDFEQAQKELIAARLTLGVVQRILTEGEKRGLVLWQHPEPGAEVSVRTPVDLAISENRGAPRARLPDVLGKRLRGAEAILSQAGFMVRQVDYVKSTAAPGTVISQQPPPGERAAQGSEVRLEVAVPKELVEMRRRRFLVQLKVPRGPVEQKVEIVVEDERGVNLVYAEKHRPGDEVNQQVTMEGEGTVYIKLNDKTIRQDRLAYTPPPEESEVDEFGFPNLGP